MIHKTAEMSPLRGKRYINLIRVSTPQQKETSVPAQLRINNEFAKRVGMIWVEDIVLVAVSGSKTFNRRDLELLVAKKKLQNSYDVIIVRDFARLTRGTPSHGHSVKRRFQRLGVVIHSVLDSVPDGDMGELMETMIFFQNHQFARFLARTIVANTISQITSGVRPPMNMNAYGVDKLLIGPDGKPSRLMRNVGVLRP